MKFCEECKQESRLDHTCTNCGLVFEDKPLDYDLPIEENNDENRKINASINARKTIKISETKNQDLKRALRKYYYPWELKRDYKMKRELKKLRDALNLSLDFYVSCYYTYLKIVKSNKEREKNIFRGAGISIETVAQGICYLEMRKQQLPFTLKDFERMGCNKKEVKNNYVKLVEELNVKIPLQNPINFVNRIVVQLNLEARKEFLLILSATSLLQKILELERINNSTGKFRNAVDRAGACIYLLTEGITQKKISEIVGCNIQTLRKRIVEMEETVNKCKNFGVIVDKVKPTTDFGEYNTIVRSLASKCGIKNDLAYYLVAFEMPSVIETYKRVFKPIFRKHLDVNEW